MNSVSRRFVSDFFGVPFQRLSTGGFARWNRDWLATWKHPRFDRRVEGLMMHPTRMANPNVSRAFI